MLFCFLQITFESDLKITSMYSSEGEEVALQEVMYPTGNVEDWMLELERIMKETMRLTLKDALNVYPKVSFDWLLEFSPLGIILLHY